MILDERINAELLEIVNLSPELKLLESFIDSSLTEIVNRSGGIDENGNLINGEQPSITIMSQIQFYEGLEEKLKVLDKESHSGKYVLSGLYFITDYWANQKEDIKISEAYIGLSIARNRILTASLLN